ncbi:hypothetical protein B0O80DRAFT_451679 [Mortierella sp. GBAus27b]|nr:StAR- lipid transfer protein 5 [Mortierella sp. GBA43]KAI8353869.1 hypothetical protein B0O80DRAFT_451679 [Mortierella sp. GBAus27b]
MGAISHTPLAALLLVTPLSIIYLVNQLLLEGVLDNTHFVFFEFIFILAFRRVFGLPDLSERWFPGQVAVHTIEPVRPAKTSIAGSDDGSSTSSGGKKKIKKGTRKAVGTGSASGSGSSTPTTAPAPKKVVKKEQPYAKEMVAMEKKFMDYVNNKDIWEKVYEENTRGLIEVYQYKARPMCYKVIAVMNNSPAATFDYMSEIERRVDWDPLCEEARSLVNVTPGVKVQYMRTRGIWPTASRDTLVLGTVKKLGEDSYFNVTTSIEHAVMPPRTKEGYVRMETSVAGQTFEPIPGEPNKTRVVQILDADLKGWIPDKVIQMVSTKAVPGGMRKVNKILPSIEPYAESKILKKIDELKQAAEEQQDGGEDVPEDGAPSHELNPRQAPIPSELPEPGSYGPGPIERRKPSTFRTFWRGLKHSIGYSENSGRASKIIVATFVLAVLGPSIARYRRQRR